MFTGTYGRGAAAEAVGGASWFAAMLEVEAALARAAARTGRASGEAAARVVAACDPARFDVEALAREGAEHASPVVALVAALREAVGEQDAAAVHVGATSQDVLDTAMVLVTRRALEAIGDDAHGAADAAADLAAEHRDVPCLGRTLGRHALPTTFGLRAAGWMTALDAAVAEIARARDRLGDVQLGGPVGTGDPALAGALAAELGLRAPTAPWHTDRTRVTRTAGALGTLAAALAKPARDVVWLGAEELAELRETGDGRGASSAMAHKRNPVAAVSTLACTTRVPGLVATLLTAAGDGLAERAAGGWQAEWGTVSDLVALTGSAAAWGRDLLEGLEVDPSALARPFRDPPDTGHAALLVDRALAAR